MVTVLSSCSPETKVNTDHQNKYIGLAKEFIQIFPYYVTENLERTFWQTQYLRYKKGNFL